MARFILPSTTSGLRVATARWLNVLAGLLIAYEAYLLFYVAYLAWSREDLPDPQLAHRPVLGPWREDPVFRPLVARMLTMPAASLATAIASAVVRWNLAAVLLGGASILILVLVNFYFAWLLR
ncbi:MAG: hypothetical protein KDA42_08615 [Planctomycetales bacterium]|nr:hypothetical protein [Planctomycetales bacterium]